MEFYGTGDPFFGGNAADWCLYIQGDGSLGLVSERGAQRRKKLVMAYLSTDYEAEAAGAAV